MTTAAFFASALHRSSRSRFFSSGGAGGSDGGRSANTARRQGRSRCNLTCRGQIVADELTAGMLMLERRPCRRVPGPARDCDRGKYPI